MLRYEDTALCDVETGELVDEDRRGLGYRQPARCHPGEGLRHTATVTDTTAFVPEYFCLDYRAAGLTLDKWFARNTGMVDTHTDPTVDRDDEAREAARQKAQAERAEAQKRARRKVLALNKLGDTALGVRRDFVQKLLARKTPPKRGGSRHRRLPGP